MQIKQTNKQTNQINKIGSSACLKVKLTVDMIPCGITSTHCPLVVTLRNYTNLLRQIRHDNITKLVKQRPVNAFKINLWPHYHKWYSVIFCMFRCLNKPKQEAAWDQLETFLTLTLDSFEKLAKLANTSVSAMLFVFTYYCHIFR